MRYKAVNVLVVTNLVTLVLLGAALFSRKSDFSSPNPLPSPPAATPVKNSGEQGSPVSLPHKTIVPAGHRKNSVVTIAGNDADRIRAKKEYPTLNTMLARLRLDSRYADLFISLKLPKDKIDALKSLLADRQLSGADTKSAALAKGYNLTSQEAANVQKTEESAIDAEIKNLLGDAEYQKYQHYMATYPERREGKALAERIAYMSDAISDQQLNDLIDAIATTAKNDDASGASGSSKISTVDRLSQHLNSALGVNSLSQEQKAAIADYYDEIIGYEKLRSEVYSKPGSK